MKVIVLGGDGFCGWPTALHLSNLGHSIIIVDNLSRRNIDNELEVSSLTPIAPIGQRLKAWTEVTGKEIKSSSVISFSTHLHLFENLIFADLYFLILKYIHINNIICLLQII